MAFLLSKLGFWGLVSSVVASGAILVTAISFLMILSRMAVYSRAKG